MIKENQKFKCFTTIYRAPNIISNEDSYKSWFCECECGAIYTINEKSLIDGNVSCDCQERKTKKTIKKDTSIINEMAIITESKPITKESTISKKRRGRKKHENKYDLTSKPYGIGYCSNDNSEFYFDLEDFDKIKDYTWSNFYGQIFSFYGNGGAIRMCNLLLDVKENEHVSHIHRDSTNDNRKSNLRIVNSSQKQWNKKMNCNNTSGVRGVCYDTNKNRWIAEITCYGRRHRGYFDTKADAIKQRKEWERVYFGEYGYDSSQAIEREAL